MDREKRKKTAAVAAVLTYLRTMEESAALQGAGEPVAATAAPGPSSPVGFWGHSGRQHQMQLRTLMQMKSFHGSRLR